VAIPVLELKNLAKEIARPQRDPFKIFQNLNCSLRDGEFVSVVGPSGCGKTTMLRVINGLLPRTGGQILIDGKPFEDFDRELVMGFVFQSASLLPWRTSLKNILLGLEGRGPERKEAEQIARKYLDLVGLSGFENHYPHELSGGMQQRVNLARALAVNPRILLMDEPFAALDAQTKLEMQEELVAIWQKHRCTIVFVTHSVDEALVLGNKIVVMTRRPGRIRESVTFDLPRPRDFTSPEFNDAKRRVLALIREESTRGTQVA
jgi:NitT/TauT family transport system ATP-binding protein